MAFCASFGQRSVYPDDADAATYKIVYIEVRSRFDTKNQSLIKATATKNQYLSGAPQGTVQNSKYNIQSCLYNLHMNLFWDLKRNDFTGSSSEPWYSRFHPEHKQNCSHQKKSHQNYQFELYSEKSHILVIAACNYSPWMLSLAYLSRILNRKFHLAYYSLVALSFPREQ